jgi:predicted RNase H-like HicB family nuclease
MTHYIALIHKDPDSCYGVSFPDVPGVVTAGDTLDEAMRHAAEVLEFAAEDWSGKVPAPRTIDELRADSLFQQDARDPVIAAIPFDRKAEAAE